MAVFGHKSREKGRSAKADREKQRRDLWERTSREVDQIVADYHARFPRQRAKAIGVAYARYSTRHQDSVPDQIRGILEDAIKLEVFVPREFVFFDLAVRGFKAQRQGLSGVECLLKGKKATTLLLFATNRLFRKVYRTLEFVERVHKGWGIRCVFIKSGVDTNDTKQWEMILHAQSMIDQFVVTLYIDHIKAAHAGLLEKRLVFGTLSFGFRGEPIPGLTTVHGKPRCQIVLDETTSSIVRRVFHWFVVDKLSVNEIIRQLNGDESIPLPPRCTSGVWTRVAVLRLLRNTRYRGVWQYGVTESVYNPESDYVKQHVRVEPIKQIAIEELRIVDDETWFAAQKRLSAERFRNGGRRPVEVGKAPRPRLLNGLFYCPEHNHILYVGGPHGCSMFCPRCRGAIAAKRPLFSALNREIALRFTCMRLAELVRADESLVNEVIAACQREAAAEQQPDPQRLHQLRKREQQLQGQIEFNQRHPGDTEADQAETARVLRELRSERNDILLEIARIEEARKRKPLVPTIEEARSMLESLGDILIAAADGKSEEDSAAARGIIDLLTGGRIDLHQMGERAQNRGWLQGRFQVDVISVLASKASGVQLAAIESGTEVRIDYRRELLIEEQSEHAFRLYHENKLEKEIAVELGVGRSYVTKLLEHAFAKRGLQRPDGRKRRHSLPNSQSATPLYKLIADEAVDLMKKGWSDLAIGRYFKTTGTTACKAIAHWFGSRGLTAPTGNERRRMVLERARKLFEEGMLIKDIARLIDYSPRGLALALKEFYASLGQKMPDGRSRRGNVKSGQSASGHAAQNGKHDAS